MEEPSLLDYLKSKLNPRRLFSKGSKDSTILSDFSEKPEEQTPVNIEPLKPIFSALPWRSLLTVFLALAAQRFLEPPALTPKWGVFLYVAAGCMLVYAILKKEWHFEPHPFMETNPIELGVRRGPLFFFIPMILISLLAFSGNTFTVLNVFLWMATLALGLITFWIPEKRIDWKEFKNKIVEYVQHPAISFKIDYWKLLVLAAFLVAAWFHFYQLNSIPGNMTSDHTEKLLDVSHLLEGQTSIFFANNGGREPIHFYLVALFVKVFHAGLNFFTLKLTMTLVFLLSLVYMYRLGCEIGTRWTGLLAMLFMGFAAWPNMITRVGLRLVLTPVFVAPVLFYLLRGLRLSRRNDFIVSGILLGLGLLGYSATRILPLVVVVGVLIFSIYQRLNRKSGYAWWALGLLALFALVLFLPLLRFSLQYPELIGERTLTRMTSVEKTLTGSVLGVFLTNFWNAATMPFWKDGSTWVISIPNRPALDLYSAAFYFIGIVLLLYRWIRTRSWQDLFLLLSIPLLMLPSILSLAFPDENPSLSRAGGAAVPIFITTAIGLETFITSMWQKSKRTAPKVILIIFSVLLVMLSASQNFDLALRQYPQQYANATWNTSQMGNVAKDFISMTGEEDNVWVVGVAHWADTRLVAMSAGYINKDYAIWPEDIDQTLSISGAKLFIVKYNDETGMAELKKNYPQGFSIYHSSEIEGRDFIAYMVPPVE